LPLKLDQAGFDGILKVLVKYINHDPHPASPNWPVLPRGRRRRRQEIWRAERMTSAILIRRGTIFDGGDKPGIIAEIWCLTRTNIAGEDANAIPFANFARDEEQAREMRCGISIT
jgi:hypothetical protein